MKPGTKVNVVLNDKVLTSGTIEYRTADGWYGVREASGRLDEWQWWQVAVA